MEKKGKDRKSEKTQRRNSPPLPVPSSFSFRFLPFLSVAFLSLLFLLFHPFPSFAASAPPTLADIAAHFDALDSSMTSLTCRFVEEMNLGAGAPSQSVSGFVQYKKPDLLRIEYKTPEAQSVVLDGKDLWIWRPSAGQAIETSVADWKESQPMARQLLDFGHYGRMLADYEVSIASVSAPDARGFYDVLLDLKPKNGGGYTLRLGLSTRDYFPARTWMTVGSVTMESVFSDVRLNPAISGNAFHFTPPPDADVFRNFKLPQAGQ
ncbi:MAG TPA: outer membrane lipoprotein carrier protein LolA [Elusimicrobiota bacterium]|nr:outer membrane lipoprotein carrier protein LolA [Elusimicrobiota bacterium]